MYFRSISLPATLSLLGRALASVDVVGALPIHVSLTAKILIGLYISQGAASVLFPEKIANAYKAKATQMTLSISQVSGTYVLASGIMSFCLIVQETSIYTAIGSAWAAILVNYLRLILTDTKKHDGGSTFSLWLATSLSAAVSVFTLANLPQADAIVKFVAGFGILNGLVGSFSPKTFASMYNLKEPKGGNDTLLLFTCQCDGVYLLTLNVAVWTALSGTDPYKVLAYSTLITCVHFAVALLRGVYRSLRIPETPILAWVLILGAAPATILLS